MNETQILKNLHIWSFVYYILMDFHENICSQMYHYACFCYIYTFLTSRCRQPVVFWALQIILQSNWFRASKSFLSPITNRSCYWSFVHMQGVGTSFWWVGRELCECLCRKSRTQKHSCPIECLSLPPSAECMKSLVLQALYMYWYWKPCLIIIILDFFFFLNIHLYLQVIWKLQSGLESLFVQDVQHVCVM